MDIWKPTRIEPQQCLHAQIGPLKLWLKRTLDELHIAVERQAEEEAKAEVVALEPTPGELPDGLSWGRWVIGEGTAEVWLLPAMPDRPLVVRPEARVKIPAGLEALFFVSIPVWVRISTGEGGELKLCEEPSVVLSNTWFGDPASGELCYSLLSRARRKLKSSDARPHRAICPVRIHNAAAGQLDVQRLCVHAEHLRIYDGAKQPWTNEVKITVRGEGQASQIDFAKNPPNFEAVGELLSDARTPVTHSILKRGVSSLGLFGGA